MGEKTRTTMRDLKSRIAAILVFVPVVLIAIWLGGIWFVLALAVAGAIMAHEWVRIVFGPNRYEQLLLHVSAAVFGAVGLHWFGPMATVVVLGCFWVASIIALRAHGQSFGFWALAGVPYLAAFVMALELIRVDPVHGLAGVLWLFFCVWGADSLAYFAGRTFGGPKLWPAVSPNKTWSGLAGAVLGSAIVSVLFAIGAGYPGVFALLLVGAFVGVVEQAGDLFESAMKRQHDVKDSGTLLPGHGGLLDRLDGLAAAAVFACLIGSARNGQDQVATGVLIW